ncbi:dihydroxyacetone kinase phosphoryl donor subunit DhaM [Sebaldella sp. S0638]|uniref:dihydroxyacetone kinase phosphoryl donor subunit DhaM n=1 Tax=Sebaldella sp. S0638 TaxID=2957809 RepID=UPI00209EA2B2|nr:dihydroxyacetone kinase phosphoryl donor subunit DhaM [Sebaldella sp. S0638]MCP1225963.1 dihydroxyacetone kinase phosphoryl donor subunit DhaM [Sebaldella sp. S0638]
MENKNNLVGIVVVSHNKQLAQEIINFAKEMQHCDFAIENGGGLEGDTYGTNPLRILEALKKADRGSGVLIFLDMGSAVMNVEMALEMFGSEGEARVADVPLVEGVIAAVAGNFQGVTLDELEEIAEESKTFNKKNN